MFCSYYGEYSRFYKVENSFFNMITYHDIYEIIRKEKYSETLQPLPKNFIIDVSEYLNEKRVESAKEDDLFLDASAKSKKQFENSISLFKELILRRKKKLLNLVFVAAETGIMKRDYENMVSFEREEFEKLVKAFEEGDRELAKMIKGRQGEHEQAKHKMILFTQDAEQFVDMSGGVVGPFVNGELANLDSDVAQIIVSSGKANFVDEN